MDPPPPPSPPQDPTPTPTTKKYHGTPPPIHYLSLAAAVLAPLGAALPSRGPKTLASRVQNYVLYAGCFWSLNQLAFDYTGTSMVQRTNARVDRGIAWVGRKVGGAGEVLPTERAREVKAMLERERRGRSGVEGEGEGDKRGFWKRLWMGEEREGWQERRLEEERKALESGKGYSDLIWEAFEEAWGTKKTGETREKKGEGEEKK